MAEMATVTATIEAQVAQDPSGSRGCGNLSLCGQFLPRRYGIKLLWLLPTRCLKSVMLNLLQFHLAFICVLTTRQYYFSLN